MARPKIQKYLDHADLLRCPVCADELFAAHDSLRCANGHTVSVSSKGFATMVPNVTPLKGYDEAFFASRQRVLSAGYYEPVLDELLKVLEAYGQPGPILDAGCGEGYYAHGIEQSGRTPVLGLDFSKDAVRIAARGANRSLWLVADLAHMPLRSGCVQTLINVFTPANYREFKRVMAPGALLVKVVPAARHMEELRGRVRFLEASNTYSNEKIVSHFDEYFQRVETLRVTHTQTVAPDLRRDVARMSPVCFDADFGTLDLEGLNRITVDAQILVAYNR